MRYNVEQETLTIYLEGELNTFTSEQVEKDVEQIMSENTFNKVILDLEHLRYISSTGLRIIVRIKQKYSDTSIVNAQSSVYAIFKMVGFDNMMKIEELK